MTAPEARVSTRTDDRLLRTIQRLLAIQATELRPTLDQACSLVVEALAADKVDVFLYDAEADSLVAMGIADTPMGRKQRALSLDRRRIDEGGPTVKVFQTGSPYRTGRYDRDPDHLYEVSHRLGVTSMMNAPINVDGERRGVLQADSQHPEYFTEVDLVFLIAVAGWIGIMTHRAELFERLMQDAEQRGRRQAGDELRRITQREREIAILIAHGLPNEEIAERLLLEREAVADHTTHIFRKLGFRHRAQIAAWGVENGLYAPGDDDDV